MSCLAQDRVIPASLSDGDNEASILVMSCSQGKAGPDPRAGPMCCWPNAPECAAPPRRRAGCDKGPPCIDRLPCTSRDALAAVPWDARRRRSGPHNAAGGASAGCVDQRCKRRWHVSEVPQPLVPDCPPGPSSSGRLAPGPTVRGQTSSRRPRSLPPPKPSFPIGADPDRCLVSRPKRLSHRIVVGEVDPRLFGDVHRPHLSGPWVACIDHHVTMVATPRHYRSLHRPEGGPPVLICPRG